MPAEIVKLGRIRVGGSWQWGWAVRGVPARRAVRWTLLPLATQANLTNPSFELGSGGDATSWTEVGVPDTGGIKGFAMSYDGSPNIGPQRRNAVFGSYPTAGSWWMCIGSPDGSGTNNRGGANAIACGPGLVYQQVSQLVDFSTLAQLRFDFQTVGTWYLANAPGGWGPLTMHARLYVADASTFDHWTLSNNAQLLYTLKTGANNTNTSGTPTIDVSALSGSKHLCWRIYVEHASVGNFQWDACGVRLDNIVGLNPWAITDSRIKAVNPHPGFPNVGWSDANGVAAAVYDVAADISGAAISARAEWHP